MELDEATIRSGIFFGLFAVMAIWELIAPRRPLQQAKWRRWLNNLGLVVLNTAILRLLFPMAAVGFALSAEQKGWGLFNLVQLPPVLAVVLSFLALDLLIYWQHRLFHSIPLFWRLHRMHHVDTDFDVTTALRFHTVEILLSMVIKAVAIALLGAPALAVLVFEIVLNGTAMFNHGNVRLARPVDRFLRLFLVTPDMHRVHHSDIPYETNSNYGFNLTWWDRLFASYRDQPEKGHEGMTIGLEIFRDQREQWLDRLLTQPFRKGD